MDAQCAELSRDLIALGLMMPDEQPAWTPLPGGVSSAIFRVDLRSGPVCVKRALPQLRVEQEWQAPIERNAIEVAWLRTVGTIAPRSVPAVLGEDRRAGFFVMRYLTPEQYPNWKSQLLDGTISPDTAAAVGELLARIHASTAHDHDLERSFADADAFFYALRLDPYFMSAAKAQAQCAPALHELVQRTADTRIALVHGDCSPKNILVGPDGPVLIDAEAACFGDPAFDLAFCLSHLLLKMRVAPAREHGYLACFDALSAAYMRGVSWEQPAILEARAATLLPALLLARIDGKSPVEYLSRDSDRRAIRNTTTALLRQPVDRLRAVRSAWLRQGAA